MTGYYKPTPDRPIRILYFVSVDWFFHSHFSARAAAAQRSGYDIYVLTSKSDHHAQFSDCKFNVYYLEFDRKSLNLVSTIICIFRVIQVIRKVRPDIVHNVAVKPILIGSLAARILGVGKVVNAVTGSGYAYTSSSLLMRLFRPILTFCLRFLLAPSDGRVVFENLDDLSSFVRSRLVSSAQAVLIRGAGVDPARYLKSRVASDTPLVVLPARLLWDKGLLEFVEAARLIRIRGLIARFAIVGGEDPCNRGCIPSRTLSRWQEEGVVELWGFRADMPEVLAQADIVCLPSYSEGLPKALLEGMAAGLPCVTTDVPGCREVVRNGDNGLLVPAKDIASLAAAIETLLVNPSWARAMGRRGRQRAKLEFSEALVNQSTLKLYREILEE